jgi:hypothetical protein
MSLEIIAVKDLSKVYGPVISRLVATSATSFIAKKLSEQPPTSDSLDQVVAYIKKSQSKYPKAYTGLGYGVIKGVSILEGNSGGGTRLFTSLMKVVLNSMGLKKMIGDVASTADAIRKNTKFNEDMNTIPKGAAEIVGDQDSAIETTTGCDYSDVCTQLTQEGVTRAAVGGLECTYALADIAAASILTGADHDYEVLSFKPPMCEYKIFRIKQ